MKKSLSFCLGLSLVILCAQNVSAEVPGFKIGVVNYEVAFTQEKEAQAYIDELKKEEEKIIQAEEQARANIEKEMAAISKLDEKAKQAKQAALGVTINNLQQQFTKQRMELEQKRTTKQTDLQRKNQILVDDIRVKKGLHMILNGAMVVSKDDKVVIDVTPDLTERYNKAYPVEAEKPKPGAKAKGTKK